MRNRDHGPGNGDLSEGHYTNYFEIGHNAFEFLLDFGQLYFERAEGRMHTRIITAPVFAKRLADVLNRALSEYEQTHGPLPEEAKERDGARMGNMRLIYGLKNY